MDLRPESSISKTEVDSVEDVNSRNLDLPLRDNRASKERKSHLLCAFVPDSSLGYSFAQFYSVLTKFHRNRYCYSISR